MERRRIALTAVVVAALAISGCGGGDEDTTATDTETTTTETSAAGSTLRGSVGPEFVISLTTDDGQPVESLAAGAYTIEVEDLSSAHNFHLSGPGVDESTEVSGEGPATFEVDLQAGSYTFVCDPHASSMAGNFEVTG